MKAYKKEEGLSYTEGFFPTFELLHNRRDLFETLYVTEEAVTSEAYQKLQKEVKKEKIQIISTKNLKKIGAKENAHVVATFKAFESVLDPAESHLVMVNPSDMGNLGNAMRTLLAFGCHDLALITPCADPFNPKVIRASMGAIFHIRIRTFPSFEAYLKAYPRAYYPFVLERSKPLSEVVFQKPCALVFGNEATGLPKEIYNENDVRIEQSDEVDSLNLTTSIAIALYEMKMQR